MSDRSRSPIKLALAVGLTLAALPASGCRGFSATPPAGFAVFATPWWQIAHDFRAVSPDGVLFRIRRADHEPKAELAFWKEALKKRMNDAGYAVQSERDVKADGKTGYLLELAAPLGQQDYSYVLAVFDQGRHLVVAESAGEVTRFNARRADVLAAIENIDL